MLQQVGAHFGRIGRFLVDLVDRHDHRHLCRLGMRDRFDRLGHHGIVRRNHQDHDIGHVRTAGAHRGKGRVARRIQEGQRGALVGRHLIGPDMLGNAAGFARNDTGLADCIQQRGLAVVDVAHDRHDRRARRQIFVAVQNLVDDLFDIAVGNADRTVTEFLDHQFGGIGIDGLVHRHHHAHFHKRFDDICGAFRHAVRQFLNHDGLGKLHVAHHLFGAHVQAQRLLAGLFLLALHRGKAACPPAFTGQRLVQRQLAGAAHVFATLGLGLGVTVALFALPVGLARAQARLGRTRRLGCGSSAAGRLVAGLGLGRDLRLLGVFGAAGLHLGQGLGALFFFNLLTLGRGALALFALPRLDLVALALTFLFAGNLIGRTLQRFACLAGLGVAQRGKAPFHLCVRDAGGPFRGIAEMRCRPRCPGRSGSAGLRDDHALALGLDHDVLRPAVAEALLHLSGTRAAKAKRFLTVSIAHAFFVSFDAAVPPNCLRIPASRDASSTTRVVSPPAASAPCIACSRPKAKPNSRAVRQPMNVSLPPGACSLVLPRSDPSLA